MTGSYSFFALGIVLVRVAELDRLAGGSKLGITVGGRRDAPGFETGVVVGGWLVRDSQGARGAGGGFGV